MPTFYSPQYARWLLGLYWLQWLVWAYRPPFFQEWLLENVLPFLFVGLLIVTHRRFPLSNISYSLIFVFMCLHTVGAHYTYSLVPYHRWSQDFLGLGIVQWGQHGIEFVVHRCTSKACGDSVGSAVPRCQRRRQRRNLSRGASSWIAGPTGQRGGAMGERCLELGWNCGGWPSAPMAGPCQVKINTTRCVAYTVKRDSCTVVA